MKIKRLELVGFKSFKDKTVINFDQGITGIVGPNGCGKSNIVDALVWVMGEQSAKHLRGSSMEDVIFSGSENFAPLGMAEVSLTLENDGGPFPAKWIKHSEIMITRRLHRSGESEYLINKEDARLKDVLDIFMDTGAGSKGFSIIEQGQIGKIITAKPEDRRVLIEEAAGITKFKVRKRESQRKLESTEQNLVRLNDIIGELRRQLDSLQRQAKRAERYKEIKNQAQDLDLWLSSVKFELLNNEVISLTQVLEEKKLIETDAQIQIEVLAAELQTLKLDLLEKEKSLLTNQTEFFEIQSTAQKKESDIKILSFEIESTKKTEEVTSTLKTEVQARQEILVRDFDHTSQQFTEVQGELEGLVTDAITKSEASTSAHMNARVSDEKLTQLRRELMSVMQNLTGVDVRREAMENQKRDLESRSTQITAVFDELKNKETQFHDNRKKAFNGLENQRQMQLSIMTDVENFQHNLNQVKTNTVEKRQLVASLKDEYNKVVSRLYGLETVNTNFEGLGEGVKNVMMWQRERLQPSADGSLSAAGFDSGFELVADVVEVPKDYELAMEAALGDRLQSVLSPTSPSSLAAMDLLKEKKGGRTSFFSKDLMGEKSSSAPAPAPTTVTVGGSQVDLSMAKSAFADLLNDSDTPSVSTNTFSSVARLIKGEGVHGYLTDLVKCPERHQKVLAQIMEGVVVVDTLPTALKLRARFPHHTFVTTDGDVLNKDGSLEGGSSDSADSGLLRTKREIKELSMLRDEASGKLALSQAMLEKLESQLLSVTKDLEGAQKQSFEQEILIHDRRKDLERSESELKNVEEALRRQTRDVDLVKNQILAVTEQIIQAVKTLEELTIKRAGLDGSTTGLEEELSSLRSQLDSLSKSATEAQVRAASKEQMAASLKNQKTKLESGIKDVDHQLSRMKDDSSKNSSLIGNLVVKLEEARRELNLSLDRIKDSEEGLKKAKDDFEILSNEVRTRETKSSALQSAKNSSQHDMGEAQIKQSQAELNMKYVVDQITERYMLNISEVTAQYQDRAADDNSLQNAAAELEDLKDKIKKIGEVNLTAIQEFEELTKRYEFLTTQQQDLLGAMDSLRKVIDRINRICHRRFRDTFEAVNERFKKVFPVLFGGGEAQLILTESPDSHGDPGVEIMARPPGKKLQSVTLLSGGEKALTAVSLIFSIFLYKPSPFCLLDEVDAPLDDANVYRFNDLVREMARRSQVILVTHNKHTMEINNLLYGVTMEDPGVSKMVAVRMER